MSRGLGQGQLGILTLLLESGGVLTMTGILMGLDKATTGPGTREYNRIHSSLCRTLKGLRERGLVMTYKGINMGGHSVRVVSLTAQGIAAARQIEWGEGEEEES